MNLAACTHIEPTPRWAWLKSETVIYLLHHVFKEFAGASDFCHAAGRALPCWPEAAVASRLPRPRQPIRFFLVLEVSEDNWEVGRVF